MSKVFSNFPIIINGVPTSKSIPASVTNLSVERVSTDAYFYADVYIKNILVGSSYILTRTDNTVIASGTAGSTDITISSIAAYSLTEILNLKVRKHGYEEYTVSAQHARAGTVMYNAQIVDDNVTEMDDSIVSNYSGYSVDFPASEYTSGNDRNKMYDYSIYASSLLANITYDYPLSTAIGVNFLLASGWELILDQGMSGGLNITGNVKLTAVTNLTDHNISGQLTFTVAGTYTITDSTITELINTSGGNVIINSVNSSFTTNTGPDITINNSVPVSVNVKDKDTGSPIENAHVYLIKKSDHSVILSDSTDANGDVSTTYNYISDVDIVGWVRQMDLLGDDYVPEDISGTIKSSGFNTNIQLRKI